MTCADMMTVFVPAEVIKRSGQNSRAGREAFLAARMAFDLGAAHRYSADIIEYHYHKDLRTLQRCLDRATVQS